MAAEPYIKAIQATRVTRQRYVITFYNYGILVTRRSDNAEVFFQGGDADEFMSELESTHDGWTDDDVCSQYDDVMQIKE